MRSGYPKWPAGVRHRRQLAVLAATVLGAAWLQAGEIETLVVTASRNDESATDVPASISVLSAKELGLIGAVHISEALARVPGVWVSRGNGQENLTAIRSPVFTGTGSCGAFYVAEDGVPIRPAGVCNVNELSEVNTEQAARIEVLRGPGTAVHGANALHGVINVISQAAPREGTADALSAQGGPHGYARMLAQHGSGDASGGWLLTLNAGHDGGYKDESGYNQQKAGLHIDHDWGEVQLASQLSYARLDQDTAGFVIGEGAYRRSDRKRENPNPEAFRDNQALRWAGRFDIQLDEDSELSLTPYLRYQDMRFLQHFLLGEPLEENGLKSAGLQSNWRKSLGSALQLQTGVDAEWSDSWLQETQQDPVPDNSSLPAGKHYDYSVTGLNSAGFVQLEWQPHATTRVVSGVRVERQDYAYDNRMLSGATRDDGTPCGPPGDPRPCRYSRPADSDDSFTEPSWNAGVIQDIGAQQQLVLNYAHGFRPPQAAELYRLQAGQLVTDIKSEKADSIELGWRGSAGDFSYAVSGYLMDKDEVIFQDSERRNVSGASTRHRGVEYSVVWNLAEQWRLAADGTWAKHTYESDDGLQGLPPGTAISGNEMDTAPESMASVRLGWSPDARTEAELEWQHMSRYYLEPTATFDYPGHDLLNLRVSRELGSAWSATARVTNLTDDDYAERADYAFGDYRYFIGEPRALYLEIAWRSP
jgi:iron complex outermembrane recepter protein